MKILFQIIIPIIFCILKKIFKLQCFSAWMSLTVYIPESRFLSKCIISFRVWTEDFSVRWLKMIPIRWKWCLVAKKNGNRKCHIYLFLQLQNKQQQNHAFYLTFPNRLWLNSLFPIYSFNLYRFLLFCEMVFKYNTSVCILKTENIFSLESYNIQAIKINKST